VVARKYVSLNIEYPPLPRAFLKILKMANESTEPVMHLTKVTMTTILSERKAVPWKRDIEKTKETQHFITGSSLWLAPVIRKRILSIRYYARCDWSIVLGVLNCMYGTLKWLNFPSKWKFKTFSHSKLCIALRIVTDTLICFRRALEKWT